MAGFVTNEHQNTSRPRLDGWELQDKAWVNIKTGKRIPLISGGGGTPSFDQDRFRFRNDDADLDNATWKAALNTNISWPINQNIRLRFAVQETAGVRTTNQLFELYYSINGGSYTYNYPGSYMSSPYFSDETRDNVQRLGTGQTFKGGGGNTSGAIGAGDWLDYGGSDEWELEFCFRVPTTCVFGDTIDFRVYRWNGTSYVAINTYTNTPRITVAGTTKSNKPALARGGGYPTSDVNAFLEGDYKRTRSPAYAEGYRDGYSAKIAWMRGRAAKIPAYLTGKSGIVVAVVPFNARTSTGTQDITSTKLAGLSCKVAFFYGVGASAYDTVTANARIFFGATNGTGQWVRAGYMLDGAATSYTQGSYSNSACAGFLISSGGQAAFDSFITNGIRINWSAAAPGAYKCWAILIGAPNDEVFKSKVGYWAGSDPPMDGSKTTIDVGWRPRTVMFHKRWGSQIQMGLGIAFEDERGILTQGVRGADWDQGYFNVCGGYSNSQYVQAYRVETDYWSKITEFLNTGFVVENTQGGTYQDSGNYVAMQYAGDFEIRPVIQSYTVGTNVVINTGNKPLAVIINTNPFGQVEYPWNQDQCATPGYMAFDDTYSDGGVINHGWSSDYVETMKSIASQAADLAYRQDQLIKRKATRTSMNSNGFTLNYSAGSGTVYMFAIVFAYAPRPQSYQHCYLGGQSRKQPAYTRGSLNTKSSCKAFFNVVSAQDERHCYTEGQNPPRSSKHAFILGTGTAVIAVVPFTTNGLSTQDITSLDLGGAQPKACLVIATYAVLDEFSTGNQCIGFGFTDGTRSYYETMFTAYDTSHPYTFGWRRGYGYGFVCTTNASGTATLKGTFNSWVTNGIRINWTTISSGVRCVAIFFGGSSVSARVGQVTRNPGSTTAVTDPAFTPDLMYYAAMRGAASEESSYASAMDLYATMLYGMAVNDGARSQMYAPWYAKSGVSYATGCVTAGGGGTRPCMGQLGGNTVLHSFDTNGFTSWFESGSPTGTDAYLAISFGGKLKCALDWVTFGKSAMGLTDLTMPNSLRNITPVFMWLMFGHNDYTNQGTKDGVVQEYGITVGDISTSGYGMCDVNGPTLAIASNTNLYTFACLYQGWFMDCNWNEWSDLTAADYCSHTELQAWWSSFYDQHEYTQHIGATLDGLITNGLRLNVNLNGGKFHDYYDGDENTRDAWKWPLLIVGPYEDKSRVPCYAKGLIANWPNRTPRGCYCEGAMAGTPASSNTDAFLDGIGVTVRSDQTAYLKGQDSAHYNQEAFAKGLTTDKDSQAAYLGGILGSYSSMPAYTQSGWDIKDNQWAYIWCDYSRSSAHGYLAGDVAGGNVTARAAYTLGGGIFPFTDDFTGSDGSTWNNLKWDTDEQ